MRTTNGSQCCSYRIRAHGDPRPPTQAPQGAAWSAHLMCVCQLMAWGGLTPLPSSLACFCNQTAMLVLVLSCPLEHGDPPPPAPTLH